MAFCFYMDEAFRQRILDGKNCREKKTEPMSIQQTHSFVPNRKQSKMKNAPAWIHKKTYTHFKLFGLNRIWIEANNARTTRNYVLLPSTFQIIIINIKLLPQIETHNTIRRWNHMKMKKKKIMSASELNTFSSLLFSFLFFVLYNFFFHQETKRRKMKRVRKNLFNSHKLLLFTAKAETLNVIFVISRKIQKKKNAETKPEAIKSSESKSNFYAPKINSDKKK